MFILDLQWLIFVIVLILVLAMALAPRVEHHLGRRIAGQPDLPGLEEIAPLLEDAPFGLALLEGAHTFRYANPYVCRVLGLAAAAGTLPDAPWTSLLNGDRLAARQEGAAAARYRVVGIPLGYSKDRWSDDPDHASPSHPDQPGQPDRFIRWWVTPVGNLDLVFFLDVTSQQRGEETSRSLINDLSHELRTPLATILTHLEVQELSTISAETRQQSMYLLKTEARRMVRLVNQMLELGRLETSVEIERRPVDILTLVEGTVAQVAPQAKERQITLSVQADTRLPLVVGDGDRLRQVFLNLLDNAVKYCRPGDQAAVSLQRVGDAILCSVSDNGPGILARHLPHLTRRFYRAGSQEMAGSGLGLSLTEEILRRHDSHLAIESTAEGTETGTRARFTLPIMAAGESKP